MLYNKQLDSIRGIAVLMVVASHWIAKDIYALTPFRLSVLGSFGVDAFFVLSGFLITGILFNAGINIRTKSVPVSIVLKNFYLRRFLRIFPIFYLVIFILYLLNHRTIYIKNHELLYSALYVINFHFHSVREWSSYTSHFWSLAVEEQFYILWPWLILLLRRKYLPYLIFLFIGISLVWHLFRHADFDSIFTPSCFDAFGLGGLLAWVHFYSSKHSELFYRIVTVFAILCFAIITIEFVFNYYVDVLPHRFIHSICVTWLIASVIQRRQIIQKNFLFNFLNNRRLIYTGKISYGVYLYHLYIPHLSSWFLMTFFGIKIILDNTSSSNLLFIVFNLLLLFIITHISWRFIEQPILKLKSYFWEGFEKPAPESGLQPGLVPIV